MRRQRLCCSPRGFSDAGTHRPSSAFLLRLDISHQMFVQYVCPGSIDPCSHVYQVCRRSQGVFSVAVHIAPAGATRASLAGGTRAAARAAWRVRHRWARQGCRSSRYRRCCSTFARRRACQPQEPRLIFLLSSQRWGASRYMPRWRRVDVRRALERFCRRASHARRRMTSVIWRLISTVRRPANRSTRGTTWRWRGASKVQWQR